MRFLTNINKMLALTEAGFDDEECNAISRKKPGDGEKNKNNKN